MDAQMKQIPISNSNMYARLARRTTRDSANTVKKTIKNIAAKSHSPASTGTSVFQKLVPKTVSSGTKPREY